MILFRSIWNRIYTGKGYLQGIGFDIEYKTFEIPLLKYKRITDIKIDVESEWLNKLKDKLRNKKAPK